MDDKQAAPCNKDGRMTHDLVIVSDTDFDLSRSSCRR